MDHAELTTAEGAALTGSTNARLLHAPVILLAILSVFIWSINGRAEAQTLTVSAQWCVKTTVQQTPDLNCNNPVTAADGTSTTRILTTATAARAEMVAQGNRLLATGHIMPEKLAAELKRISLTLPASADHCTFTLRSDEPGTSVPVIAYRPVPGSP